MERVMVCCLSEIHTSLFNPPPSPNCLPLSLSLIFFFSLSPGEENRKGETVKERGDRTGEKVFVLKHFLSSEECLSRQEREFAGVQAINAAILDVRPDLRKYESYVILVICIFCWLLAIPMIFDGGIYLFTLMDWNTASWAILLIGVAEVVLASWCYGCNKFLCNIAEMQMKFGRLLHSYWWLSWVVLAPITCLGVFVYQMYTYESASYGEYVFPGWANTIGILIGLSTLAPFPIFFGIHLWKILRKSYLFRPTNLWGPAIKKDNLDSDSIETAIVKSEQIRNEH